MKKEQLRKQKRAERVAARKAGKKAKRAGKKAIKDVMKAKESQSQTNPVPESAKQESPGYQKPAEVAGVRPNLNAAYGYSQPQQPKPNTWAGTKPQSFMPPHVQSFNQGFSSIGRDLRPRPQSIQQMMQHQKLDKIGNY